MAHRTARGLRAGIERYFTAREEEGRFPTEAGLLLELGLSEAGYADKAGQGAEKRLVIRLEGVGRGAAE